MKKIIFSRKGFDIASGGYPSPILPDGTMLSFPIPEASETFYKDLKYNAKSYLELMGGLGIKGFDENSRVHLDPDINRNIVERQEQTWEAIFGQCDSSASHLDNQNIKEGDLFLFFGWFRKTIETATGLKYDPKDKTGKHVLWGYLEVGKAFKIVKEDECPRHYLNHPHFEPNSYSNNTAYIASEKLSFDETKYGAGTFKFDESLVLSCSTGLKSIWQLPLCFHPDNGTQITYHTNPEKWTKEDTYCTLQSVGRGQEFIISGNPDVKQWAKNIIIQHS